nr:hypothetical protein Itr_chr05CG14300 [Ipomoea trifida]
MLNQTPFPLLALGATVAAHPHLPPLPQPRLEAPSSPKESREGRKRLGLLGWEVAIAKLRYRRRPTSLKRETKATALLLPWRSPATIHRRRWRSPAARWETPPRCPPEDAGAGLLQPVAPLPTQLRPTPSELC